VVPGLVRAVLLLVLALPNESQPAPSVLPPQTVLFVRLA
jgi:hypothetical protein